MTTPERLARRAACSAFTVLVLSGTGLAQAQGSAAPLRTVVPFGPGATTDIVARRVGAAMAAALGQTLVVEDKAEAVNRSGVQVD